MTKESLIAEFDKWVVQFKKGTKMFDPNIQVEVCALCGVNVDRLREFFLKAFDSGVESERERIKKAVKKSKLPGLNKAVIFSIFSSY